MDNNNYENYIKELISIYSQTDAIIDKLPNAISIATKIMVKKAIHDDKFLSNFMNSIDKERPPRIFLIGRTGFGKSSLVNAILGSYCAEVSDIKSCTAGTKYYKCLDNDKVLMEILDTRGVSESESLDGDEAEKSLMKEVKRVSPDVAILVLNCKHRDGIDKDVLFVKKITEKYKKQKGKSLPVIVVVNKCDEMSPARIKDVNEYPKNKIDKIEEVVKSYKEIAESNGLEIDDIIGISSLIDWKTKEGKEIGPDEINNLSFDEINSLEIAFDGRYNIDRLLEVLYNAIRDVEAQNGFRRAVVIKSVSVLIAENLIKTFATISGTLALNPLNVNETETVVVLQAFLVKLIATLGGENISLEEGISFVLDIGKNNNDKDSNSFMDIIKNVPKVLGFVFPIQTFTVNSCIDSISTYKWTEEIGKAAIIHFLYGMIK